jgi:hypothetical protein
MSGAASSSANASTGGGVFAVPVGRATSGLPHGPGALTGASAQLAVEVGLPAAAQGDLILQQDVISVLAHCARPRGGGPLSASLGLSLQRAKWGLPVARNQPAYLTATLPPSSLVYSTPAEAEPATARTSTAESVPAPTVESGTAVVPMDTGVVPATNT